MRGKESIIALGCLAIAALFIGLGFADEGYQDVLNKAVFLCYECIGIG
ncbi:MAG: hypothetical protein HDT38_06615 [Clostridiales bacterium]|nr:hypothetical protein [Clostridiales bacterium]